jgi:hypothetical protein
MSISAEKVVTEAMGLPPALRAFVAEKLIESLDVPDTPPLSAKWKKEIRRRCKAMDRGEIKLRDASAVFAKAKKHSLSASCSENERTALSLWRSCICTASRAIGKTDRFYTPGFECLE